MIPAVKPLDVFDKFVDVDAEFTILKEFVEEEIDKMKQYVADELADFVTEYITPLTGRMDDAEGAISSLDGRVIALESAIGGLGEDLGALADIPGTISDIQGEISDIWSAISALQPPPP